MRVLRLFCQIGQSLEANERKERDEGASHGPAPTSEVDRQHCAEMQFGCRDHPCDRCHDQSADFQDTDRRSNPDALADAIGCYCGAPDDQQRQQDLRGPGQQDGEIADRTPCDRRGGDRNCCGYKEAGQAGQGLGAEAVFHIGNRAGGFREAAREFGVAQPGHGSRDAGDQESDRRRVARTCDHRAYGNVYTRANDDAEAVE